MPENRLKTILFLGLTAVSNCPFDQRKRRHASEATNVASDGPSFSYGPHFHPGISRIVVDNGSINEADRVGSVSLLITVT